MTNNANKCDISIDIHRTIKNATPYTGKTDEYIKHIQKITSENGILFKHGKRDGLSDANILAGFGVLCLMVWVR